MADIKIDEAQISRGRLLKALLELPEAKPLIEEIDSRIQLYDGRIDEFRRDAHEDRIILSSVDRRNELKDLRTWIQDEIEAGGREILRKANKTDLGGNPATGPQDVK